MKDASKINDNKDDDLKNKRMSSRLNHIHFKDQEESWIQESRIKFQESRSRFKTQDSGIKRRLNQDNY